MSYTPSIEEGESMGDEELRCIQESDKCEGDVEWYISTDRPDFKAFPRCRVHREEREAQAEKNREFQGDCAPAWFDPTFAGERWEED